MTPEAGRPVCLDVTRLVSRVGTGPYTGIDRVEDAYLSVLLASDVPLFGLARTATGFVLLARDGLSKLKLRLDNGEPWGPEDIEARLSRRISPARRRAEADLRRLSLGRSGRRGLSRLLTAHLSPGTLYLNTGHSDLDPRVFSAVRRVRGGRSAVLIHDTIPLRRPDLQRPGTLRRFDEKLCAVASGADVVICTTETERRHIETEIARRGGRPMFLTACPGLDPPRADPRFVAKGGIPRDPYFAVVGTIEPRKNLSLLLDVWEALTDASPDTGVPGLCVIGRRGWEDAGTLARLDALKAREPAVREYPDLADGAKAALVASARALLFPSLDEGFGFPPLEAYALGTPVVCAPLDVFLETMGDAPVYANTGDMYHWLNVVRDFAGDDGSLRAKIGSRAVRRTLPTWQDHVTRVLTMIPRTP